MWGGTTRLDKKAIRIEHLHCKSLNSLVWLVERKLFHNIITRCRHGDSILKIFSMLARKAASMCEGSASYSHVSCLGSPQWKDEKKLHSHQQMWINIIGLPAWISHENSWAIQLQVQTAEQPFLGMRVAVATIAQERRVSQIEEWCLVKIEGIVFIQFDLCLNFNCLPCVLLVRQGGSSSL